MHAEALHHAPRRPARSPEESPQDRSRREWAANFHRVAAAPDLGEISSKDIERARHYAERVAQDELRKGWTGGEVNQALVHAMRHEIELLRFELRLRAARRAMVVREVSS